MTGDIGTEYYAMLAAWLVLPILLFLMQSRGRRLAGVIVYAYLFGLFVNHWMGALVHGFPWNQFQDSTDTIQGFELSTYGLLAFFLGVMVMGRSPVPRLSAAAMAQQHHDPAADVPIRSATVVLVAGVLGWILSYTPFASLPSAAAVLSAGKQSLLLGVCLFCWIYWHRGDMRSFWIWVGVAFLLPVVTVITSGFLGYGIAMLGTILVFVAMFYRPRWVLLAGLVVGIYGGMSLWVAYAINRNEVRSAVWGGQDIDARTGAMSKVVDALTPFDPSNQDHLQQIDARLNQNWLVGAAMRATPAMVPFENGYTIYEALTALIPRAIWPDKPAVGGSGDYAGKHAMINFAYGTSVGMGQVFEFYINFGVPGVVLGFVGLGMLLRYIDLRVIRALEQGDFNNMQFWFLLGTGANQAGGSLAEIVGAMAGGGVLSAAISYYLKRKAKTPQPSVRSPTGPRG